MVSLEPVSPEAVLPEPVLLLLAGVPLDPVPAGTTRNVPATIRLGSAMSLTAASVHATVVP